MLLVIYIRLEFIRIQLPCDSSPLSTAASTYVEAPTFKDRAATYFHDAMSADTTGDNSRDRLVPLTKPGSTRLTTTSSADTYSSSFHRNIISKSFDVLYWSNTSKFLLSSNEGRSGEAVRLRNLAWKARPEPTIDIRPAPDDNYGDLRLRIGRRRMHSSIVEM